MNKAKLFYYKIKNAWFDFGDGYLHIFRNTEYDKGICDECPYFNESRYLKGKAFCRSELTQKFYDIRS